MNPENIAWLSIGSAWGNGQRRPRTAAVGFRADRCNSARYRAQRVAGLAILSQQPDRIPRTADTVPSEPLA